MTMPRFRLIVMLLGLGFASSLFAMGSKDPGIHSLNAVSAMDMAILRYQTIAQRGGWPKIPEGGKRRIEPGQADRRIPAIREVLTIQGDFARIHYDPAQIVDAGISPETYDEATQAAMREFQKRHGLTPDGVIGFATLDALRVPVEKRIRQLQVNRPRIEKFVQQTKFSGRSVLVNIPAFTLQGLENDVPQFSMKVIVGRKDRPTPLFNDRMTDLQFHPFWYVPDKIAAKDLLPKIKENPEMLESGGYTLFSEGERVEPGDVDWEAMDEENFHFRLRQHPGNYNALGDIKFNLTNDMAIYLHDTSKPELFAKDARALSSGCVRVEQPQKLMRFVAEYNAEATTSELDAILTGRTQRVVKLTQPVPVHVVYWTAFAGNDGTVFFFEDVYGKSPP